MSESSGHILIVDDDLDLCRLLSAYLRKFGFEVDAVGNGQAMDAWLAANKTDLIILDIMMPGEDGLSIARRLREKSHMPIIIHSASGDEIDRIVGLEMGADDYLPKPANPRELLARIKSILRRSTIAQEAMAQARASKPAFGDYQLDEIKLQLCSPTRPSISLSMRELSLLKVLLDNVDSEISRDQLMQHLRGFERDPLDRSIDVCVNRLRKKIEPDPSNPIYIRTIWGKGYIFTPGGSGK